MWFGFDQLNEGYGFGLQLIYSNLKLVHTDANCTHTQQLKQIQEICSHFLKSLGLF